jgi:hypothetical protein
MDVHQSERAVVMRAGNGSIQLTTWMVRGDAIGIHRVLVASYKIHVKTRDYNDTYLEQEQPRRDTAWTGDRGRMG